MRKLFFYTKSRGKNLLFLPGTEQGLSDWILNTAAPLLRHSKDFCGNQASGHICGDVVCEKENVKAQRSDCPNEADIRRLGNT